MCPETRKGDILLNVIAICQKESKKGLIAHFGTNVIDLIPDSALI